MNDQAHEELNFLRNFQLPQRDEDRTTQGGGIFQTPKEGPTRQSTTNPQQRRESSQNEKKTHVTK